MAAPPTTTAELCVVFVVLFVPLLSVAIFVVSPISAFGKMALAGGWACQLSPSLPLSPLLFGRKRGWQRRGGESFVRLG